jgi:hypothetical protein
VTGPDDVPWDRVVHFYGRAGEVPKWIAMLDTDDHAGAERRLGDSLEHQGGVMQATPLAVRQILLALGSGRVRDAAAVGRLLERIRAAARDQIETLQGSIPGAVRADWSLFRRERWWPPFESELVDDGLWESWGATDEEQLGWALLTESLLK